jgi:hypothetical protein
MVEPRQLDIGSASSGDMLTTDGSSWQETSDLTVDLVDDYIETSLVAGVLAVTATYGGGAGKMAQATPSPAGKIIYVINAIPGPSLFFSDGSVWRSFVDRSSLVF